MANKRDFQPLLDLQQNQLNLVFSSSDTLDSKNLALLALNVALLVFAAQESLSAHIGWVVLLAVLFLLSISANLVAIWPRSYVGAIVDVENHPEYLTLAPDKLVLQLIADTQYAIEKNTALNNTKLLFCLTSLALSVTGTFVLLLCIINS